MICKSIIVIEMFRLVGCSDMRVNEWMDGWMGGGRKVRGDRVGSVGVGGKQGGDE